jgi:hypothetical protein
LDFLGGLFSKEDIGSYAPFGTNQFDDAIVSELEGAVFPSILSAELLVKSVSCCRHESSR